MTDKNFYKNRLKGEVKKRVGANLLYSGKVRFLIEKQDSRRSV